MTFDGPKAAQNGDLSNADGAANQIRVLLADSQAIYRVGMRKIFALEDDIRVVAQAETLENLFAALARFPTDVVLLEGALITGTIDAIPEFVRRAPGSQADRARSPRPMRAIPWNCTAAAFAVWYRGRSRRISW